MNRDVSPATAGMWLDLLTEGDPHPRRFSDAQSLRLFLSRSERLSPEATEVLLSTRRVDPPLTRLGYRVRPFPEPPAQPGSMPPGTTLPGGAAPDGDPAI